MRVFLETVQSRPHRGEQKIVVKGLLEKIRGADLHRFHGERHIAMAGDDDDRQAVLDFPQVAQQVDPGHFRHADIGDDATGLDAGQRRKERLGRFVASNLELCAAQEKFQRMANGVIVVDNMNHRFRRHRQDPPVSRRVT